MSYIRNNDNIVVAGRKGSGGVVASNRGGINRGKVSQNLVKAARGVLHWIGVFEWRAKAEKLSFVVLCYFAGAMTWESAKMQWTSFQYTRLTEKYNTVPTSHNSEFVGRNFRLCAACCLVPIVRKK
jgi:hypothetical protein